MTDPQDNTPTIPADPAVLLTDIQVAHLLSVSPRTLQKWRVVGGGPRYHRLNGRMIRYSRKDIEEWSEKFILENTSQGGGDEAT